MKLPKLSENQLTIVEGVALFAFVVVLFVFIMIISTGMRP